MKVHACLCVCVCVCVCVRAYHQSIDIVHVMHSIVGAIFQVV